MELMQQISEHLQQGSDEEVAALTRRALDEGLPAQEILHSGLLAGMQVIGGQFRAHEIFLPDVLLAAKAMYAGIELLQPILEAGGGFGLPKIIIGTVQGDLHDIGKNLVGIMARGAGFEVIDLGKDVAPQTFIDAALKHSAPIIGMSALLTTTMPVMAGVVELLREQGLADQIRTIVGGAPLTENYAREIGATAYAYDAANAVEQLKLLTQECDGVAAQSN